ncbi:MAG: UvrB/UvrC motif-containing protein [Parachlamydiaceae bacterium]|nr:UvrB/UvrC motif-containing protein [Parachlamydiaceae bacterium]
MIEKKSDKSLPPADRPLECGECKKPITVRYTEIVGDSIVNTSMCADCPELTRRLFGTTPAEQLHGITGQTNLGCGNCGTTLEDVKRGHRLGCMECYNVFGDLLLQEMQTAERLPPRILSGKKSQPTHIGRSPGESLVINLSSRLLALDEALKETLSREDYEQAAWLRDQIKALTENEDQKKGEGESTNEGTKNE